jgi:hypothetical protein
MDVENVRIDVEHIFNRKLVKQWYVITGLLDIIRIQ